MKLFRTDKAPSRFSLLTSSREAQVAMMILQAGDASDDVPTNEHPRCEQWLFVISGRGVATIGKRRHAMRRISLRQNSLLLIEKGELHQITNTASHPLTTINFYVPPAYDHDGEPKPRAKSTK